MTFGKCAAFPKLVMSSITFAHRQFMTHSRPRKTTVSAGRFPFFVGMDLETIYKCENPSRISQALSSSSFDYLQYTHMYTHTCTKRRKTRRKPWSQNYCMSVTNPYLWEYMLRNQDYFQNCKLKNWGRILWCISLSQYLAVLLSPDLEPHGNMFKLLPQVPRQATCAVNPLRVFISNNHD